MIVCMLLNLTVALVFNTDTLGTLSAGTVFGVFFYLVLVIFTTSFFKTFRLALPSG